MDSREAKEWNRLLTEAMHDEFDKNSCSNFRYDFGTLTKKYGRAYIKYCQCAWEASGGEMGEEEFCQINGNIPYGFFAKKIKK
jgi:hypothetical protein